MKGSMLGRLPAAVVVADRLESHRLPGLLLAILRILAPRAKNVLEWTYLVGVMKRYSNISKGKR